MNGYHTAIIGPPALTYADVTIVPRRSDLTSRQEPKLGVRLPDGYEIGIPITMANMESCSGPTIWRALAPYKAMLCAPRHAHPDPELDLAEQCAWVREFGDRLWLTLGVDNPERHIERLRRLLEAAEGRLGGVIIDPVNGHSKPPIEMVEKVRNLFPDLRIISGNVVTPEAVRDLARAGATIVKVGMGPGAVCLTRGQTGVGVPQLTAVLECAAAGNAMNPQVPIIADGGIEGPADAFKALCAGGWLTMFGKRWCQTEETPARTRELREQKEVELGGDPIMVTHQALYVGLASEGHQSAFKGGMKKRTVREGTAKWFDILFTVESLLDWFLGGIKSGMTYVGCRTLPELRNPNNPIEFREVRPGFGTESGVRTS